MGLKPKKNPIIAAKSLTRNYLSHKSQWKTLQTTEQTTYYIGEYAWVRVHRPKCEQ